MDNNNPRVAAVRTQHSRRLHRQNIQRRRTNSTAGVHVWMKKRTKRECKNPTSCPLRLPCCRRYRRVLVSPTALQRQLQRGVCTPTTGNTHSLYTHHVQTHTFHWQLLRSKPSLSSALSARALPPPIKPHHTRTVAATRSRHRRSLLFYTHKKLPKKKQDRHPPLSVSLKYFQPQKHDSNRFCCCWLTRTSLFQVPSFSSPRSVKHRQIQSRHSVVSVCRHTSRVRILALHTYNSTLYWRGASMRNAPQAQRLLD